MKRILLLFLLLCGVSAFAQKPIYVYFNDGTFKAFLSSQIDHISLAPANDDPESEMFLQEFWTADSVYRYPVHTIDSIGSYMPPTKFKDEAIDLSGDLLDYVISADTTHVFLQLDTPTHLLPQTGQKLGYPTMDEIFPYGFAGEVKSVSKDTEAIVVDCTPVMLDKVFDTFYLVVITEGSDESKSNTRAQRAPLKEGNVRKWHFPLGTHTWSLSAELSKNIRKSDDLAIGGGLSASIAFTNEFDITTYFVVNSDMGYNVQVSIYGKHDVEWNGGIYGGIEYKHDLTKTKFKAPIGYGLNFIENCGFFVDVAATLSGSSNITQQFRSACCFELSSRHQSVLKPAFSFKPTDTEADIKLALDGRFAIGGYLEGGVDWLLPDIAEAAFRAEAGVELTGSAVLLKTDVENSKHDTKAYNKLKDSPIALRPFIATSIESGLGAWKRSFSLSYIPFGSFWQRDLVPTFSNTKLTPNAGDYKSIDASVEARGNCLFSVPVSFVLFDKNEKEVAACAFSKKYTNTPSLFQHTFNNLGMGQYSLYPQVSFLGFDLLASPSSKDQLKAPAPEITNLHQAGNYHDGYNYGGQTYKYKFDLIVKAQVETLEEVEDWGFVYKSPTGEDIKRSFMQQGTSAEYMFSIFSNQNTTSSSIYTYIVYSDNKTITGSPYTFDLSQPKEPEDPEEPEVFHTCPDNHHPHLIDLGLPSGTKWACCNVGAHAPEEPGGYYAWGETSEKSYYDWSTYKYATYKYADDLYSITKYCTESDYGIVDGKTELDPEDDAAYVNWGAGWRMPSVEQQDELIVYCTWNWDSEKKGDTVVGPNKASLFLPAAGYRYEGSLRYAGSWCYYWSRSLTYYLNTNTYYIDWNYGHRFRGFSVRPVRVSGSE